MQSKRQLQAAQLIKRAFSQVLLAEGSYLYGQAFVTVTNVIISPDFGIAKIYLSIYNTEEKDKVIDVLNENNISLRQKLGKQIRRHIRRIPEVAFYLDDMLDEMYRLRDVFDDLNKNESN